MLGFGSIQYVPYICSTEGGADRGRTRSTPAESRVRHFVPLRYMSASLTDSIADYMNGFKCNVTGSTSNVALAKPQVPRRCGADPDFNKADAVPGNCTYGAKQPFYWFQSERNNVCNLSPLSSSQRLTPLAPAT